jgi:hypothetical protein
MRKYLLFVICIVLLVSCDKKAAVPGLEGSWVLKSRSGGMIAQPVSIQGYGIVLEGNAYKKYVDGQLVQSGSYILTSEKSFIDDRVMTRIIYDNNQSHKTFAEIKNSELIIYVGAHIAADGIMETYVLGDIAISD